jgi:hypothetical protein
MWKIHWPPCDPTFQPAIADWRELIEHASTRSKFIGVDPDSFPRDFAVYARHHGELLRMIRQRCPMPAPLTLRQLDQFLDASARQYDVEWIREARPLAA